MFFVIHSRSPTLTEGRSCAEETMAEITTSEVQRILFMGWGFSAMVDKGIENNPQSPPGSNIPLNDTKDATECLRSRYHFLQNLFHQRRESKFGYGLGKSVSVIGCLVTGVPFLHLAFYILHSVRSISDALAS